MQAHRAVDLAVALEERDLVDPVVGQVAPHLPELTSLPEESSSRQCHTDDGGGSLLPNVEGSSECVMWRG